MEQNTQNGQNGQNGQKQFQCTGDCLNCTPMQRQYCAAQKSQDNQRILLRMVSELGAMRSQVAELGKTVAALQGNENVFNPNKAQNGDGAE